MFSFSHPFRVADSGVYSVVGRKGGRVSAERKARSGRVYGEFKHKGKKTQRVSLVDLHTIHAFLRVFLPLWSKSELLGDVQHTLNGFDGACGNVRVDFDGR